MVATKTSVVTILAMVALGLTVGPHAFAQQPLTNPPVDATDAGAEPWTGAARSAGRDGAERPAAAGAADFFTLGQILC